MQTFKVSIGKMTKQNVVLFFILAILMVVHSGCSSMNHNPKSISILPIEPMSNTSASSYLSIDTLYKSDEYIVLTASWTRIRQSEGHTRKWEVVNDEGKSIYSSVEKDVTIRPHTYTTHGIDLGQFSEDELKPGKLKISLYIDDIQMKTREITYSNKSIISEKKHQIVILPFYESCSFPDEWPDSSKQYFANTISTALYSEIQRTFPDTIPHYVSEQKVGKTLKSSCFDNIECISYVKDQFGDKVFLYGYSYMQQIDLNSSFITVFIYDMKTGNKKKYHSALRYLDSHTSLMNDLLHNILYEKGLLKGLETPDKQDPPAAPKEIDWSVYEKNG